LFLYNNVREFCVVRGLFPLMKRVYNTIVKSFTLRLKTVFQGHRARTLAAAAVIIVIVLAGVGFYLQSRGYVWANWTGFGDYTGSVLKDNRGKTLWDWMGLLLVPIGVVFVATLWSNYQQRAESKRADVRAALEREIALDGQREEAMRSYFDKIGQLLMEKDLLKTKDAPQDTKEAAIRDYAQILTITALRSLDTERKNMVLQFLRDTGLADFILVSASLANSDLKNTDMSLINLKRADLFMANLTRAELIEANLTRADLNETNLFEAILIGANLSGASLVDANLIRANLFEANLTEADGVTEEQISQAILNNTIMPDGSVRENNSANEL
jgi:uncharacterized protein YjbI with pentapeptide repeats